MPQLTRPYENYERPGLVVNYRLAAVAVHKGALLGVGADGFARPMTPDTAGLAFIGFAVESQDNSTGAAGAKSINVAKSGACVVKAADGVTPVQAHIGRSAFAAGDWEVRPDQTSLTNPYSVGAIVALERTSTGHQGYRIRIDRHTF
ncbi:MAG: hypothetical protein MH204_01150 [Fimbriimonadaceae bacterium]|nr:hypothetical protein [Fimbriimonadaceae bacterium]